MNNLDSSPANIDANTGKPHISEMPHPANPDPKPPTDAPHDTPTAPHDTLNVPHTTPYNPYHSSPHSQPEKVPVYTKNSPDGEEVSSHWILLN